MKNKETGFTAIELILALSITVVILTAMFPMFNLSTKTFIDVDVKSDLQREAQDAEEKINNVGMQAHKIDKITVIDKTTLAESEIDLEKSYSELTTLFTDFNGDKLTGSAENNDKCLNIKDIKIITKEEVAGASPTDPTTIQDVSYTIRYEQTPERENDRKKLRGTLSIQKDGGSKWEIGKDVESITIKPGTFSGQLSQADSIQFSINFVKRRGFSDVKYSVPINVTFRNKTGH